MYRVRAKVDTLPIQLVESTEPELVSRTFKTNWPWVGHSHTREEVVGSKWWKRTRAAFRGFFRGQFALRAPTKVAGRRGRVLSRLSHHLPPSGSCHTPPKSKPAVFPPLPLLMRSFEQVNQLHAACNSR